jgi:hypothetical protein
VPGNVTFVDYFGDSHGTSFGFVAYDSNDATIYLVFRGTDDLKGWIADVDFFPTELPVKTKKKGIYFYYYYLVLIFEKFYDENKKKRCCYRK